ncbi:MAG: LPS-assembly protein LptD [Gammaproteobacteria bacterium]|nr:LPS-assembly protein LptD [Gammaproteobacteria bacterium]
MPELRLPFRRPGLYVEPAAAYRYTRYDLDDVMPGQDSAPTRAAPVLSLDTGMTFERAVGANAERLQTWNRACCISTCRSASRPTCRSSTPACPT